MDANRATKIRQLRELVQHGAYEVDTDAVADGILLWLSGTGLVRGSAAPARHAGHRRSAVPTGVTSPAGAGHRGRRLAAWLTCA